MINELEIINVKGDKFSNNGCQGDKWTKIICRSMTFQSARLSQSPVPKATMTDFVNARTDWGRHYTGCYIWGEQPAASFDPGHKYETSARESRECCFYTVCHHLGTEPWHSQIVWSRIYSLVRFLELSEKWRQGNKMEILRTRGWCRREGLGLYFPTECLAVYKSSQ